MGKFGKVTSTVRVLLVTSSEGGETKGKSGIGFIVEGLHAVAHVLVTTVAARLTRVSLGRVDKGYSVRFADVDGGIDGGLVACVMQREKKE